MLKPEELEENRQTSLKVCEQSYLMYENTKKEMLENLPKKVKEDGTPKYNEATIKKNLKLLENSQQEVVEQYVMMGGKKEDLEKLKESKKKTISRKALQEMMKKETARDALTDYINQMRAQDVNGTQKEQETQLPYQDDEPIFEVIQPEPKTSTTTEKEPLQELSREELLKKLYEIQQQEKPNVKNIEYTEQKIQPEVNVQQETLKVNTPPIESYAASTGKIYDTISLPSKGQCYRNKKDKIKVAYLTAYDENMILSPSMYKDGKFIDYLLKAKVFDNDIEPEDLTRGDRDAIVLWLRATGYGNEYPIVVTDDETGKEFETTVDLSTLNYKPFKLKGDENGYFNFTLPSTGDVIKFKFLTTRDLEVLDKLKTEENNKLNVLNVRQLCSNLMDAVRDNKLISFNAQQKIKSVVELVRDEISQNYNEETDLSFSHELTDRLLLQTVSINGVLDRKYIENYIFNMNVKDAAAYRKHILDNEPGIDFNIEVERPASLGGGSIKSFLRLDQFIFVNF